MSELQLGLIVIGVALVAGVVLFNWLQERRFRKRVEHAFRERPQDVLVGERERPQPSETDDAMRIEPRLGAEMAAAAAQPAGQSDGADPANPGSATEREAPASPGTVDPSEPPASEIDYVCEVQARRPFPAAQLGELLRGAATVGRPVQCVIWHPEQCAWVAYQGGAAGVAITRATAALQLVNRAGPAKRVQIASFRDLVRQFAQRIDAEARCPDIDQAATRSLELDKFCAEVDVSVGFNVIAPAGGALAGAKVRSFAQDAGFRFDPEGCFCLRSADGLALVTLAAQDGSRFEPDTLGELMLPGVTLLMDVPRVPDGLGAFDHMVDLGRRCADALGGVLVDDKRAPLTQAGVERFRAHLRAVHAAMVERGIEPGTPVALRLFS